MYLGEVDYWYKASNVLHFKKSNGIEQTASYNSQIALLYEHLGIVKNNWNRVTSIASNSSPAYTINLLNVATYTRASNVITLTFVGGQSLSITCPTASYATQCMVRIGHMIHALTWQKTFPYNNIHFVESGGNINSAYENAEVGDIVYVKAGTYTINSTTTWRTGIDIYCEPGAIVNIDASLNAWIAGDDAEPNGTIRFMGFAELTHEYSGTPAVKSIFTTGRENAGFPDIDLFLQFKTSEMTRDTFAVFHGGGGDVTINGLSNTGARNIDSDYEIATIDYQVAENKCYDVHAFPDNQVNTLFIFGDGFYSTIGVGGTGGWYMQSLFGMKFYMLNVMTEASAYLLEQPSAVGADPVYMWNVVCEQTGAEKAFKSNGVDAYTIYCFNSILTKNGADALVTLSGDHTEANIELDTQYVEATEIVPRLNLTGGLTEISDTLTRRDFSVGETTLTDEDDSGVVKYEVYKDGVLIHDNSNREVSDYLDKYFAGVYTARAHIGNEYSNFSNPIKYSFTMLSDLPSPAKYSVGNQVIIFNAGVLQSVIISEVRAVVSNPLNDSDGLQVNLYRFANMTIELPEDKVYASHDHCLSVLKGAYLNQDAIFPSNIVDFDVDAISVYRDMAGKYFAHIDFTTLPFSFADAVIDNVDLSSATLAPGETTKEQIKSLVASFDKDTTIWTDGNPIGLQ